MVERATPVIGIAMSVAIASGCYGHTDFVIVEPVRYVQPPTMPLSEARFGWVSTTADKAERFRVRVGDLTYQRIIEPHKIRGEITTEAAISALAGFAEAEVVRQQFCAAASTPPDARQLVGSNTPPEMRIYVRCIR
jgi:hypothetical protein